MRVPRSASHWKSDKWCGKASSTRSPTLSWPASRQPLGVRIRWFDVQASWARPFFAGLATVICRNLSVFPLSNQFTTRLGTIAPTSGS